MLLDKLQFSDHAVLPGHDVLLDDNNLPDHDVSPDDKS